MGLLVRLVSVRGAGVADMGDLLLLPLVMLLGLLDVHGLHVGQLATVGQLVLHGLGTRGRTVPVGSKGHHLNRCSLHLPKKKNIKHAIIA